MRVDMPLAQLKEFRPPLTRRPDFDAFWAQTRAEADALPLDPVLTPVDFPLPGVDLFLVTYNGLGGVPVTARYFRPQPHLRRGGKAPGLAIFHGYNSNMAPSQEACLWALQGFAVIAPACRGQGPETVEGAADNGGTAGWMTKGILKPETYYYRAVYMDCIRALDFLQAQPEVDGSRLVVTGTSQGGGLAIATAALDRRPVLAMPDVPYLSCFERSLNLYSAGPYEELVQFFIRWPQHMETAMETLTYFDGMNLAGKITCPTLVSVGLQDTICPPSGIFAALNQMTCPLEVKVYPWNGHEGHATHYIEKLRFVRAHLG